MSTNAVHLLDMQDSISIDVSAAQPGVSTPLTKGGSDTAKEANNVYGLEPRVRGFPCHLTLVLASRRRPWSLQCSPSLIISQRCMSSKTNTLGDGVFGVAQVYIEGTDPDSNQWDDIGVVGKDAKINPVTATVAVVTVAAVSVAGTAVCVWTEVSCLQFQSLGTMLEHQ